MRFGWLVMTAASGAACEPFADECAGGSACPIEGVCSEDGTLADFAIDLLCALAEGERD